VPSRSVLGEGHVGTGGPEQSGAELPGVREDGMSGRDELPKPGTARGSPKVLPHSEGIAYKPPSGEVACARKSHMVHQSSGRPCRSSDKKSGPSSVKAYDWSAFKFLQHFP
jgi:hypothetical protein